MFRSEYGSSSIFDIMASSDHENNSPLGDLLPSFNTDFDNVRIALCNVIHDRLLACLRNVITSYNNHSAHGIFVFNSFHPMAMLNSLLPFTPRKWAYYIVTSLYHLLSRIVKRFQ